MEIFPVTYPGSRVMGERGKAIRDIVRDLDAMAHQLHTAATALHAFQSYQLPAHDVDTARETERQAEARVQTRLGPEPWRRPDESHEEWLVRRTTEWKDYQLEVRKEVWATGRVPQEYQFAGRTIIALGFVYSIDGIGKVLRDMQRNGFENTRSLVEEFKATFPDVVEIRNSQMHAEERAVGRAKGKPIELTGETPLTSGGAAFISNSFLGTRYLWTLEDGRCGQIEISFETVQAAQVLIQRTVDSFTTWAGWPQIHPN